VLRRKREGILGKEGMVRPNKQDDRMKGLDKRLEKINESEMPVGISKKEMPRHDGKKRENHLGKSDSWITAMKTA